MCNLVAKGTVSHVPVGRDPSRPRGSQPGRACGGQPARHGHTRSRRLLHRATACGCESDGGREPDSRRIEAAWLSPRPLSACAPRRRQARGQPPVARDSGRLAKRRRSRRLAGRSLPGVRVSRGDDRDPSLDANRRLRCRPVVRRTSRSVAAPRHPRHGLPRPRSARRCPAGIRDRVLFHPFTID